MLRAIEERWPAAELYQCEWHLQHALERLLAKEARSNPNHELEELRARVEGALAGPSFWLEQLTRPISAALYPRRYALKNRERLNRLLMLVQLRLNGEDHVQGYAKTIRSWLEATRVGQSGTRAIADRAGVPSLR